jgi:hypothetical protein
MLTVFTLVVFVKGKADTKARSLFTAMLLCCLFSLQSAVIYGGNVRLLNELHQHEQVYLEAGTATCKELLTETTCNANKDKGCIWSQVLKPVDDDTFVATMTCDLRLGINTRTEGTLKAVTTFASLCFVFEFVLALMLRFWYSSPSDLRHEGFMNTNQDQYVPPSIDSSFSVANPHGQAQKKDVGFDQL